MVARRYDDAFALRVARANVQHPLAGLDTGPADTLIYRIGAVKVVLVIGKERLDVEGRIILVTELAKLVLDALYL